MNMYQEIDNIIDNTQIWSSISDVYNKDFLNQFLRWQLNDMVRGKKIITIFTVELCDIETITNADIAQNFVESVKKEVRNSDFIFATDEPYKYIILFIYAGIKEVNFFINRYEATFKEQFTHTESTYYLTKGLLEIRNGQFSTERIQSELEYIHQVASLNIEKFEYKVLQQQDEKTLFKVAIIDDNELSHTVLKHLLQGLKINQTEFEISHFYNGEDYLKSEIYRSSNIQLVLISDILPERDGIEILQILRELPNEAKYFVIVLGRRNTEEEMIYAMELGADDYIAKPININLLSVKIKRLLKRGI